jgi:putative MATE family efflux protein
VSTPQPVGRAAELAALTPRRAAFVLAWPGILENLVRVLWNTSVFVLVGRTGAVELAAFGVAAQFIFLLFPVWSSLSVGTIALVSRRMGAGRPDDAAEYVRQALLLGTSLALAAGLLFVVLAEDLLRLIGAAPEVVAAGAPLIRLLGGINLFSTLSWIAFAALRGAGDTRTPLLIMLATSAAGLPLVYFLMGTLGISGVAVGMVVTDAARLAWTGGLLARGRSGLHLGFRGWRFNPDEIRTLLRISVPASGEQSIIAGGLIVMSAVAVRFGTTPLAAHNVIAQVESVSFLPLLGFSIAASALMGQALGMDDPRRGERTTWASAQTALAWTGLAGAVFFVLAEPVMSIYTRDPAVVAAGVSSLRVLGLGQPVQGVMWVLAGALRGAGDTGYLLKVTIVNWLVVRIPLAVLLGVVLGWGLLGLWSAVVLDYFVRTAFLVWRLRSRAWAQLRY